jgi:hypothetical protein
VANYSQWAKSVAPPRRITLVCGPEPVLVTEVIETIIARTAPELRLSLDAASTDEAELWAQACTYPDDSRLILVRNAQVLVNWHFLADAAEAVRTGGWVVLVSSEADIYARRRAGDDKTLTPEAAAVKAAGGQIIRCALSAANHGERIAWVQRHLPGATDSQAWEILVRCGQRLAAVASVCSKAYRAGMKPELAVQCLLDDLPGEEVADSLILGDRLTALRAAAELDPSDYGTVIGQLASRLDLMSAMHEAVQQQMGSRDAKAKLGIEPFLYARFRSVAPDYSPDQVRARRQAVARIDAAYVTGARDGIPEALAALW